MEAVQIKGLLHQNTEEMKSIMRALNGEYIEPQAGGDLLRDGAGVLPTGQPLLVYLWSCSGMQPKSHLASQPAKLESHLMSQFASLGKAHMPYLVIAAFEVLCSAECQLEHLSHCKTEQTHQSCLTAASDALTHKLIHVVPQLSTVAMLQGVTYMLLTHTACPVKLP